MGRLVGEEGLGIAVAGFQLGSSKMRSLGVNGDWMPKSRAGFKKDWLLAGELAAGVDVFTFVKKSIFHMNS